MICFIFYRCFITYIIIIMHFKLEVNYKINIFFYYFLFFFGGGGVNFDIFAKCWILVDFLNSLKKLSNKNIKLNILKTKHLGNMHF